jgi:hypothetical protein
MARAMRTPDSGLRPNQSYGAYANVGCPDFVDEMGVPIEACYDRNIAKLRVGWVGREKKQADGGTTFERLPEHNSQYKAVVGHEFGHFIGDKQWGLLNFEFVSGKVQPDTQEKMCRCDHVESGNRSHCLHSREKQGFVINEAWAHFYAAKILNDPTQAGCSFPYYKTVLYPNQLLGWQSAKPPYGEQCSGAVKWLESWCPATANRLGNEWDWLTFYYDIHKGTPSFTMNELQRVHAYACTLDSSGASRCNYTDGVFFNQADLGRLSLVGGVNGLQALGVLTVAQAQAFLQRGQDHGVDH